MEVIRAWAEDQDWTDRDFAQPPEVQQRLKATYSLVRAGEVYELNNPPGECEHEYGWVVGRAGFHEFVVIARADYSATLVVTCDD